MTSHCSHSEPADVGRREFVRLGAVGLGAALTGTGIPSRPADLTHPTTDQDPGQPFRAPPMDEVRIGFVGVGGMGQVHVRNLLDLDGARIKAICDIVPEKVAKMQQATVAAGQPRPTGYFRGETDFVRMCEEEELDLVYTATPWRWHVPVLLAAMRNGKHAASEVPMATTVEDCWRLVEAAERYGKHCVMMENVNYGRAEMMVFRMVRLGLFGEILHGECGYLHDLRAVKFADEGEGLWRREHAKHRNGNLYPTHGLGPVANCMDNNRGDRFESLVSMSSPSRGLQLWAEEHYPPRHPKRRETYVLGDVNTSLIRTAGGRTIFLSHDTNLPRPYSRIHLVQGTRGIFQGYPDRLHLEQRSPAHEWEDAGAYYEEFEHPLWRAIGRTAPGRGHGGMDYLEDYRLIKCLRDGTPTDMNVYDGVSLSVVSELSERSVATGSQPQEFPDFTRGKWRTNPRLGVIEA